MAGLIVHGVPFFGFGYSTRSIVRRFSFHFLAAAAIDIPARTAFTAAAVSGCCLAPMSVYCGILPHPVKRFVRYFYCAVRQALNPIARLACLYAFLASGCSEGHSFR